MTQPPWWAAQTFPGSARRGERFFGPQRDQLPLNLGKQPEQRHHDLGLQVLPAFEPNTLFNRHDLDVLLHQSIDDRDDFPHGTAHPAQFTDDEGITRLQTRQEDIELPFLR